MQSVLMLPKSLFCRYSIVFEASQPWQPQDQRPKRHVTVCRAIDNWQLLITAEGFGKLIRICCGCEGRGQLLQPNRVKGKKNVCWLLELQYIRKGMSRCLAIIFSQLRLRGSLTLFSWLEAMYWIKSTNYTFKLGRTVLCCLIQKSIAYQTSKLQRKFWHYIHVFVCPSQVVCEHQ